MTRKYIRRIGNNIDELQAKLKCHAIWEANEGGSTSVIILNERYLDERRIFAQTKQLYSVSRERIFCIIIW